MEHPGTYYVRIRGGQSLLSLLLPGGAAGTSTVVGHCRVGEDTRAEQVALQPSFLPLRRSDLKILLCAHCASPLAGAIPVPTRRPWQVPLREGTNLRRGGSGYA